MQLRNGFVLDLAWLVVQVDTCPTSPLYLETHQKLKEDGNGLYKNLFI